MRLKLPAVYMRGGTSKGLFFHEKDLPRDPAARDRIILSAYGSPDPYGNQIDGLGGAVSTTSKVAIISPSSGADYDVDYIFGQVSIDKPRINYKANCGNISAAVGPFAIEEGLVKVETPVTKVRIYQVNTHKKIIAEVPINNGLYEEDGEYEIDGVPGSGGRITLRFVNPGASVSKNLLPTGRVSDHLELPSIGRMRISIVDAANPVVYVRAGNLGLSGTEIHEIQQSDEIRRTLEDIRRRCAVMLGFADDLQAAGELSPEVPKIAIISSPKNYRSLSGRMIERTDIDLVIRTMTMGALHTSCAVTVAICAAGAAKISGTIANNLVSGSSIGKDEVRLGHPGGIIPVSVKISQHEAGYDYEEAVIHRTARRLMDGYVYVRKSAIE